MMNSCNFTGRLVDDPEYFPGEPDRCCFTVAVDRDVFSKDAKSANADYLDCIAWRGVAEYVQKHFSKGDLIQVVDARAKVRTYEDSKGIKKRKTEFEINRVYCLLRNREAKE